MSETLAILERASKKALWASGTLAIIITRRNYRKQEMEEIIESLKQALEELEKLCRT